MQSIPSRGTVLGRLLRWPLDRVPGTTAIRIPFGPLRGARWTREAGIHSAWLGLYERAKVREFASVLRAGDTVFDVGAHAGYYSLLALRAGARVVAVEPNPSNRGFLANHFAMNDFHDGVCVVDSAVGGSVGTVRFDVSGSYVGSISEAGSVEVAVTTLDELARAHGQPDLIKIDVEGAEGDVLFGAPQVLARGTTLFLALHGPEQRATCLELLADQGYEVTDVAGDPMEVLARPKAR
ncbi:MAG: FkbM family methyltransferase [Actinomycetes bacterium]